MKHPIWINGNLDYRHTESQPIRMSQSQWSGLIAWYLGSLIAVALIIYL